MIAAVLMIFAAVFLTILAIFFAVTALRHSPAAEIKRRLRRMEKNSQEPPSGNFSGNLLRETTRIEQHIFKLPLLRALDALITHAGLTVRPLSFLALVTGISTIVFVALLSVRVNPMAAPLTVALLLCIVFWYLQYRKQQRENRFAEQLPDALVMIARSLRAGHSLTTAVELISQELPEPAGGLFKIAYEQQLLGMRISESLGTLLDKIDSLDLHFFVTIIRINSETGGNLAEILEKLAETMRSRLQIRRQVQVYTAEGRLSGYVLVLLPIFIFMIFYFRNPEYMGVFFTERICQFSLIAAGVAQIAGFLMIRKIIDIRI